MVVWKSSEIKTTGVEEVDNIKRNIKFFFLRILQIIKF